MPTQLRRAKLTDPDTVEMPAEPVIEAPVETKKELETRRDDSRSQLEAHQAQFIAFIKRLGKGGALWEEKGWEWQEPDWSSDPETWPPVAKILYLYCRAKHEQVKANYRSHYSLAPAWCRECGGEKPANYEVGLCVNHIDWALQVKAIARDVFNAPD